METGVAVLVIFNGRASYYFFLFSIFASDFMKDYPRFYDVFGNFFFRGIKALLFSS